ncbi:MAG TPA: winged helix-turn-helix transcriptional regulator [Anaerolineae bacterium]|nr:winged helix-turn-helix transcriptional regulator [Anaerolineae bacterium]HRV95123.1 winged helix-turn-helix transcriptional regulator [Anaerolineae bacterium]
MRSPDQYDYQILSHIQENPDTTQADIATTLDVAVGSVNWYVKRLINKGYIKVTQMQRRRLRYLLTPQGVAEKTRLTKEFIQASLKWYRVTREDSKRYLQEIKQAGYTMVGIEGDGDLAEIVYLTCLEAGIEVRDKPDKSFPIFRIENFRTIVDWPDDK